MSTAKAKKVTRAEVLAALNAGAVGTNQGPSPFHGYATVRTDGPDVFATFARGMGEDRFRAALQKAGLRADSVTGRVERVGEGV